MPRSAIPVTVTIRHWLPILTYCPVNNLPDLIYVSLTFEGYGIPELYAVRRTVRKLLSGRTMYMEEAAMWVSEVYPSACVEVRLAFNRHVVTLDKYV